MVSNDDRSSWEMNEASILDEIQTTEKPVDIWGYIGIALICVTPSIPAYFPAFAGYSIWSIIIGFIILVAPNILKWKEVAGNVFIGSETYIGEDDIYEQFAVEDIITVCEAAEPFPFAEHCYKEEDITSYIDSVGGKSMISPDEIKKQIAMERKKLAEREELNPSIMRTLKAKWKLFKLRRLDKKEYHLEEDTDGETIIVKTGDDVVE